MKYRINAREEISGAEKRQRFIKWLLFSLILVALYVIMRAGIFDAWQPVFIIPLAIAVSMCERELSSCIFSLFCGYMIDIACNFIFGFSAIWLMGVCLFASLLVRNLIRVNLINFLIITLIAVFIEFSMDYLFNVVIWNIPSGTVILINSILPTAVSTMILAPLMYYLVRYIERKLTSEKIIDYNENSEEKGEQD